MLKELLITNLALIDRLHVSFAEGMTVFTGETGAGKSIVLQAIHLLGGGKAAATWIRSGAESASAEALFELRPEQIEVFEKLATMGIEADSDLLIRRVISLKGSSRYFINGSLATAKNAGDLMKSLLSVASQHDHQQLLEARSHLDFIDALGELWPMRREVGILYERWQKALLSWRELAQREEDKERRRDFLEFQCREIEEAALEAGEDELLIEERDRLRSSDELIALGRKSYRIISEVSGNSLALLRKNLDQMAALDKRISGLAEEISGNCFQLEEHVRSLGNYLDSVTSDPARLDAVCARLDLLQRLKRKYGGTLDAVIESGHNAAGELAALDALDDRLAAAHKEMVQCEEELITAASALSRARKTAALDLSEKIRAALKSLCFDQPVFLISFGKEDRPKTSADLGRLGFDHPEFMFSANPGEEARPLAKVASGGELSRLMLALKSLLARQDQVDTVIFDEIDAGISGKAAEAVARQIRALAGHHQVFCITHLPQIAALADEHFLVEKTVREGRTSTQITRLPPEKRELELARMLDGDSVSKETIAYVRTLLGRKEQP